MIPATWAEADWQTLLDRIRSGDVTPVLGAGASAHVLGTGADLASSWAAAVDYPGDDRHSLPAVAQYVASMIDRARPGEYIRERFQSLLDGFVIADLPDRHDVYRSLPRYPFPVWLTTNYDDLIRRALFSMNKPPRTGVSLWTPPEVYWDKAKYELADVQPTAKEPIVFHLHGTYEDEASMVITEEDYLEFLEQMASPEPVLAEQVQRAIATTSLLFVGYSFRDVNLQLVLRQWKIPRMAYTVRPLPDGLASEQRQAYMEFYPRYLKRVTGADLKVYWGTATDFCRDLDAHAGTER